MAAGSWTLLFTLAIGVGPTSARSGDVPAVAAASARFDHGGWDRLVSAYVDEFGRVAYARLQERDESALVDYLDALAAADPNGWPEAEQLAFWINAYNAGIVSAVLQGESAESLIGRGKLFKLWKFDVAGKRRTLDEIEHKILRKRFAEPRIHFAIVCASTSCPTLRTEAYVAARLDLQLEEQARAFLNDPSRNRFDRAAGTAALSKIFDWFEGDFERDGGLLHFVARYVDDAATGRWLRTADDIDVEHLDYDWTLNVQPGERPERRSRFH
jgi:hypothetical protein